MYWQSGLLFCTGTHGCMLYPDSGAVLQVYPSGGTGTRDGACTQTLEAAATVTRIVSSRWQAVFFGGVDPAIRGEVWPFLLRYHSWGSNAAEREARRQEKRAQYQEIQQRRWAGGVHAAVSLCPQYLSIYSPFIIHFSLSCFISLWHIFRRKRWEKNYSELIKYAY